MWISRRGGIAGEHRGVAGQGEVTIGGLEPAVRTEGEVRRAALLSPVGYYWAPEVEDDVMVLQAGDLGEEACLAGLFQQAPVQLEPGEAFIGTPESYIHIKPDGICLGGTIQLDGRLVLEGKLSVDGMLEAGDEVRLNGSVYINNILQKDD